MYRLSEKIEKAKYEILDKKDILTKYYNLL